MKVLCVRLGVLATLVMLGWITMASAQRTDDENPLRGSAPPVTDTIPDASAVGLAPSRNPAAPSRYPPRTAPATEEPSSAGPALVPASLNRPNDRPATRPPKTVRPSDRYSPSPSRLSDSAVAPSAFHDQEPPAFRADPNAMPANPPNKGSRNHFSKTASQNKGSRNLFAETASQEKDSRNGFSERSSGRLVPTSPNTFPDAFPDNNGDNSGDGVGQPGDPRLDGVQSPQLTIQKSAPKEIQVGKPAVFRVTIRNTGTAPACQVEIHDQVPRGTRLLNTMPQARRGTRGELVWTLGTIRPGEEAKVEMQLMPTTEGEVGSVATVHFGADVSVRTIATRPQLVVESVAPKKIMIGDQVTLSITVSNPGTGTATGVVLEERIPSGLQHPAGSELEYHVGDLKPGESRTLDLLLVASRAGSVTNRLTARGDGNLRVENNYDMEVVAPQLDIAVAGPKRRYLERQATYEFSVSNPGTAAAREVELVASLPPGLKFVSANNAGYYEESSRTVRWRLEELPANETGSVELVTLPLEAGQHALRIRGTAQKGLVAEKEQPVLVEGLVAILFQVADMVDPLEIGGETTYEVHVVNQGSKAASNVRLAVDFPRELRPIAAEGPTRYSVSGNRVIFDGLAQLAPKAKTVYRIRAKALQPGDLRIRFQLLTDDMQSPVTKEESTRVYADE